MSKFDKYINIPYKHAGRDFAGVDCYGLIWLMFKTERDIILKDYIYEYEWVTNGCNHISEETNKLSAEPQINWINNNNYIQYDVLFLYASTKKLVVNHMGIYLAEEDKFAHISANYNSRIDRLNGYWQSRLYGVMRYSA